eukprot:6225546-Alexandrium_andersonii.AAC.1
MDASLTGACGSRVPWAQVASARERFAPLCTPPTKRAGTPGGLLPTPLTGASSARRAPNGPRLIGPSA